MTEALNEDIKNAITTHLPAMTAGALNDFISKAEADRATLAEKEAEVERLQKLYRETSTMNRELSERETSVKERAAELDRREKDVLERERKQDLVELRVKMTEEKLDLAILLFKVPFANRTLRESVMTSASRSVPVQGQYGTQFNNESSGGSENRTTEES